MNKKFVYGIAAAVVASTTAIAVADETKEMTLEERVAALEAGNKQNEWAEKVQIKGDMRYRYEYAGVEYNSAKSRQRIRARVGAYADVNDFTTAGIRLSTGKDANSGNQTIGENFDAKGVYVDLAYIAVNPQDGKYGEVILGKMKFPWKNVSALIWDGDVNPEGVAYKYSTKMDDTGIFASAGEFKVVDENAPHDLNLITAQAGVTQPLCDSAKLTAGGSIYGYDNAAEFGAPVDYSIAEGFAEVAVKNLLPIATKFYGNYVINTAAGDDNQGTCVGVKIGDAKKGKWEAKAEYRYLEADAAPSYYADSDFVGGGTDVRGAGVKAAYNVGKHLQFGINANTGQVISDSTDKTVVLLDLVASF